MEGPDADEVRDRLPTSKLLPIPNFWLLPIFWIGDFGPVSGQKRGPDSTVNLVRQISDSCVCKRYVTALAMKAK